MPTTRRVGKLVKRAAAYGWLQRLARDIDEDIAQQEYVELLNKFKMMVRRGDIGTVGKRADRVMNLFDSILRPGAAARFPWAASAMVLLREAVEWGWKPKLARDVAAMVDDSSDDSSDGEGQRMVECAKRSGWLIQLDPADA